MQKISPENFLLLRRNHKNSKRFLSYDENDHIYSKSKIRLTSNVFIVNLNVRRILIWT